MNQLPPNASHQVGVGALVLNEKGEVLVVREKHGELRHRPFRPFLTEKNNIHKEKINDAILSWDFSFFTILWEENLERNIPKCLFFGVHPEIPA